MQASLLITTHGILHFTDLGFTQMQAALIMSAIILFSGFVGLPIGAFGDRIEPRWIISTVMFIMLLMFFVMRKTPNLWILVASGSAFGFCVGSLSVVVPALQGNYYGPKSFPQLNAVIGPISVIGSSIVPAAAGNIADKTGSYDQTFIMVNALLLCGCICSLMLKSPKIN